MNLTKLLYEAIDTRDRPRYIKHWHASSLAKCPRALFLERLGVPELAENRPKAGKKLRWRAGHAIEATIRPELQKVFPSMVANVRFFNEGLDLTGEFDGYDPVTKALISVKSVHDFAMITRQGRTGLKERLGTNAKGQATWKIKEDPYIHHEWQEHSYVTMMRDPKTVRVDDGNAFALPEWPVDEILYVYITLGGLIDTFRTPVRPELLKRVVDKLKYLNKCWAAQELPLCLCRPGQEMFDETNQWCGYRTKDGCCADKLMEVTA